MSVKQDVELRGASTTVNLRIATDERGEIVYQEQVGDGADLLDPQDGIRFVEKFDTWHKGGFIPKYIQNGWYNNAINIDCLTPGEIRPAAQRNKYITLDCTGASLNQYGIAGMAYDEVNTDVLVLVRYEGASGDNVPNRLRQFALIGTSLAEDSGGWGSNAEVTNGGTGNDVGDQVGKTDGFTNKANPIQLVRSSQREYLIPCGTEFNEVLYAGVGPKTALPAHAIVIGQGRIYKVSIDARGQVGLSNCDINATYTTTSNWTTPVIMGAFDALSTIGPAGIQLALLGGVPVVGTPDGLFVLGPGGIPENMTPQFGALSAGQGNLSTLIGGAGGLIAGLAGRGNMIWLSGGGGAPIGPNTNPLALPPKIRIMDMVEAPTGDLWVFGYHYSLDWTRNGDVWSGGIDQYMVVWVGVKEPGSRPGPGAYAWHPYIKLEGAAEITTPHILGGTKRIECDTVMLPYIDSSGNPWLLLGGGSDTDVTKLIRIDGSRFFGLEEGSAEWEGGFVADSITTAFTSGRYFRPSRNQCFFSRLTVRGYNFGESGERGGTADVDIRCDDGDFAEIGTIQNTEVAAPFETSFTINQVGFDIEWQLDWQLDGDVYEMDWNPATITGIEIEGKEIPDKVRLITMVVEAVAARKAGGTRSHALGTGLRTDLEALGYANTANLTFKDPYQNERTVYLVDSTVISAEDAQRMNVPEGSLSLRLVEVL
ncbi:hypothetical protein LCGC14_0860390 [marine sediment metagenome]|uniref:Uncharacterized protein n=1 Tax=marine sediment metagenome TaxID=412755 RepID=A0A0F9RSA2_9ZZZZ